MCFFSCPDYISESTKIIVTPKLIIFVLINDCMKLQRYILLLFVVLLAFFSCREDLVVPTVDPPKPDNPTVDIITHSDGLQYVFDIDALPEIYLEISTAEWNRLLSNFDINRDNEEYIQSNCVFVKNSRRDTLNNTGLRLRGNTSRRRPEGTQGQMHNSANPDWHHVHFTLNFEKYDKKQDLHGLEKITLKWFKDDGVYAREVYCYDLFERFGVWTSPKSSYCKLYLRITGDNRQVYYGVYQIVEQIDKQYIKNRSGKFAGNEGNLWKATWGADFKNADKNKMGVENITLNPATMVQPVYDLKTNEASLEAAKTQLEAFINYFNRKTGDDFKTWIAQRMDVPLFLKTYAVSTLCGMWDDYWNNSNNFYFYFDTDDRFYFIPYDYDNTLGTSLLMANSGTQDLLNWGQSTNPLVAKIISIPEYRAQYVSYIHELCNPENDLFYYTHSINRIKKWHTLITPFLQNDTGEDMKIKDEPATWADHDEYRLLSTTNNYFIIRAQHLPN